MVMISSGNLHRDCQQWSDKLYIYTATKLLKLKKVFSPISFRANGVRTSFTVHSDDE